MDFEELVKSAQKGDDDAFYELMSSCKLQLYRIAYSHLKSEQDALEALQETTYRSYRQLKKLKKPACFKTWVIRILINYCNDEIRRKQKVKPILQKEIDISIQKSETGRIELDMLVDQLEDPLKEIIRLKYFEDLTIRDIAEILEKPEGTIKGWLSKALNQLRFQLSEGGEKNVRF